MQWEYILFYSIHLCSENWQSWNLFTCYLVPWNPCLDKKKKKNILSLSDKSKDLTYGHTVAQPQVRSQMDGVREGPGELQTMSTSFIYINQHFR